MSLTPRLQPLAPSGFRHPFRSSPGATAAGRQAAADDRQRARARRNARFAPEPLELRLSPSNPGAGAGAGAGATVVIELASANPRPINAGPKFIDLSRPVIGPSGPA